MEREEAVTGCPSLNTVHSRCTAYYTKSQTDSANNAIRATCTGRYLCVMKSTVFSGSCIDTHSHVSSIFSALYQGDGPWQKLQLVSQHSQNCLLCWTGTCWQRTCSLPKAHLKSDPLPLAGQFEVVTAGDPDDASPWTTVCFLRQQHRLENSVFADLYLQAINTTALQVIIKALLSMPQGDGSLHLIRGNPDLTQRKGGRLVDICYKSESDAGRRAYGQVCSTPPCSCRPHHAQ